jgi:hypothetical protein
MLSFERKWQKHVAWTGKERRFWVWKIIQINVTIKGIVLGGQKRG